MLETIPYQELFKQIIKLMNNSNIGKFLLNWAENCLLFISNSGSQFCLIKQFLLNASLSYWQLSTPYFASSNSGSTFHVSFLVLLWIFPHSFLVWIQSGLSLIDMQKAWPCTSTSKVCCEYFKIRETLKSTSSLKLSITHKKESLGQASGKCSSKAQFYMEVEIISETHP